MHELIAWSGFLGAWLLVAGPLFQAAVELDAGEHQRDWLTEAAKRVDPQPRLSPWWWVLPPVAYVLARRRQRDYHERVLDALTPAEVETFVEYSNVSTGWAMVAAGAFFIAVKETYEVVELYAWPLWLLVVLLVVMLAGCAANTVVRVRRAHQMVGAPRRTSPSSPASSTS
ncbi:MAG: hypothetical protein ACRYG2_31485 [Janthinobacterium lividum]